MTSNKRELSEKAAAPAKHVEHLNDAERYASVNRTLNDPLSPYTEDELVRIAEEYARNHGLDDPVDVDAFKAGALLAKNPENPKVYENLSVDDINILDREKMNKWSQPSLFIKVILLCSVCAAVQGVDESVVNGAQIFYARQFGIDDPNSSSDPWLLGLTNGAP